MRLALALLYSLASLSAMAAEPPAPIENSLGMVFVPLPAGSF